AAPHLYPLSLHDALPILLILLASPSLQRRMLRRRRQSTTGKVIALTPPPPGQEDLVTDPADMSAAQRDAHHAWAELLDTMIDYRSEEHTSELQSRENLVC